MKSAIGQLAPVRSTMYLSIGSVSPSFISPPPMATTGIELDQHEGEETDLAVAIFGVGEVHHQTGVEDAVEFVLRLVRKIELRGEHVRLRFLRLDVDMPGAAGIDPGHDGGQLVAAGGVGELMAA